MEASFQEAILADDSFLEQLSTRLSKADTISQATNLLWYDLSPVVQMLYPFRQLIPLIGKLPRVPGDGGNAYHWKRISGINVSGMEAGVSEGNRGGVIAMQLDDQVAAYKALGFESSVSFEARLGSKNLNPDAIGNAVQATLRSLMIAEEKILMLGNASYNLGTTPTPTVTDSGTAASSGLTGGASVTVYCVALTGQGWLSASVSAKGVLQTIVRTNADGSTDSFGAGSAAISAAGNPGSLTSGHSLNASVTPVVGAYAYAWYIGNSSTKSACYLGYITTTSQLQGAILPSTSNQAASALDTNDHSTNALVPDGLLSMIYHEIFGAPPSLAMSTNPANVQTTVTTGAVSLTPSGALVYQMSGTAQLSSTTTSPAIDQIDALLLAAYEQYKIGYDKILVNVQQDQDISGLLLKGGSSGSLYRIQFAADTQGQIKSGFRVTSYLNKFMGNDLPIEVHPFVPPGTIVFWSDRVPYELPGVPNLLEAHVRQDYYEIQWPLRARRYEYGVYTDEVFVCYFPPAFAAIFNIAPGPVATATGEA